MMVRKKVRCCFMIVILIGFAIVLNHFTVKAQAVEGTIVSSGPCGENLTWTLDDEGTLVISGTGELNNFSWFEPPYIKEVIIMDGVSSIGSFVFSDFVDLEVITIPKSVTSIGYRAFSNCVNLESISLSENVMNIEYGAFEGCQQLSEIEIHEDNNIYKSVNRAIYSKDMSTLICVSANMNNSFSIPDSVTAIEDLAFSNCENLYEIIIPQSVKSIGSSAFLKCKNLRSIEIPEGVTTLEAHLFCYCENLENIVIPESVIEMEYLLFEGCSSLKNIELPDSITYIDDKCFMGCSGLEKLIIPKGVSVIWDDTFADCINLKNIELPEGIRCIGENAFKGCSSLIEIIFPETLETISGYAFSGCNELKEITFKGSAPSISYEWVFYNVVATAYYPANDPTWTQGTRNQMDGTGTITWVPYKKEITEYKGAFSFLNGDGTSDTTLSIVDYKDSYFNESSYIYNHQLAKMSLCMALSSFNAKNGNYFAKEPEELNIDNKLKTKAKNAVQLLMNCGFDVESITLNKAYLKAPEKDSIGVVLATKEINGKTLVAVIVRGGGYEREWASNFNIYNTGGKSHPGFQMAANQVLQAFNEYIIGQNITGDIKVWVTGYSRGAATANLVAAHLNDKADEYVKVSFEKKDIYAYTFETPQNTKSSDAKSSNYENIFNIINPIDVVTKVAMSDWGYTRYGTDMYIPGRETKSQYKELVLPVLNSYNAFTNKYHLYLPEIASQSYVLNKAMSGLANALGKDTSEKTYAISVAVQEVVEIITTKSDSNVLGEIMKKFKIDIPSSFKFFKEQTYDQILQGHYPEMCLAWMYNLDDYEFDKNELLYRLVHVNCPVDVNVYAKEGTLVASIKDDEVIDIEGSYISAFIDENGQKIICLPLDEEYDVQIIATDDGEVTYSVSEYDVAEACETKVVSYYDVKISDGDILSGDIDIPLNGNSNYTLKNESGEIVEPSSVKVADGINHYMVEVVSVGDGTVDGGGYYREGEFCKVTAVEHEGFEGWYIDDSLVSAELEYRFRVEKDTKIEARFKNESAGIFKEKVVRVFGATRYETSFMLADALKAQLGIDKFSTVIVTSGENFADALAGSYLAADKSAPILLTNGKNISTVHSYIKNNLASGGTVYILGGVNAVSANMEKGLTGYNIKRLQGADRYATNLAILNEVGVSGEDILICTGNGFADSLSASATGKPILLVNKNLTTDQKTFLKNVSGNNCYILGGTSAISDSLEKQIDSYVSGSLKRLGGATRYETSVLLAQTFFDNADAAVLAYAMNYPDGLSGGPLAESKKAPLILTATDVEKAAAGYVSAKGIKSGTVIGGPGLISDKAVRNVFGLSSSEKIEIWMK